MTALTSEQKEERSQWMAKLQRRLDYEYGVSVGRTAHAAVGTDEALRSYASVPLDELTAWQLGYESGVYLADGEARKLTEVTS